MHYVIDRDVGKDRKYVFDVASRGLIYPCLLANVDRAIVEACFEALIYFCQVYVRCNIDYR